MGTFLLVKFDWLGVHNKTGTLWVKDCIHH